MTIAEGQAGAGRELATAEWQAGGRELATDRRRERRRTTVRVPAKATTEEAGGRPPGRLFVVATPIGNLADVTLRALEILGSVPLIAAEDTRVTRRLLLRHGIVGPGRRGPRLVSYHARNAARRAPELLAELRRGADVALVTDAGTPAISDPGGGLVTAWAAEGGAVVPIPGPSAVTAALAAAGIAGPRWVFEGFLPRRGGPRRRRLRELAGFEGGAVVFEAGPRIGQTLADLAAVLGSDRSVALCRELTKVHEEILRGTLGDLARQAAEGALETRGEWVIVVGPPVGGGGEGPDP